MKKLIDKLIGHFLYWLVMRKPPREPFKDRPGSYRKTKDE